MERKSGSSSRSPSLSRRPSLKDKKPTVISKPKKKATPGAKKERWLLTRKTWRYMSDAVGNLLPTDYRGAGSSGRRGSQFPTPTEQQHQASSSSSSYPQSSSNVNPPPELPESTDGRTHQQQTHQEQQQQQQQQQEQQQPQEKGLVNYSTVPSELISGQSGQNSQTRRGSNLPGPSSSSPEQFPELSPIPVTSPSAIKTPHQSHHYHEPLLNQQQFGPQDIQFQNVKQKQKQLQRFQAPEQYIPHRPHTSTSTSSSTSIQQQQQQQQQKLEQQKQEQQKQEQQQLQQLPLLQQKQQQGPKPEDSSSSGNPVSPQQNPQQGLLSKVKPSSVISSAYSWCSFPSHRPGVTPTGSSSGHSASANPSTSSSAFLASGASRAPVDARDFTAIEQHFKDVCNKETHYLLWTKTKAKGLSGPSLRTQKLKEAEESGNTERGGMSPQGAHPVLAQSPEPRLTSIEKQDFYSDYYSPEEGEFGDDDDYDEYMHEDQITVRERRRSSTASQTIIGPMSCFRPMSTYSSSGSDTTYMMIVTGSGVQKILRNTGIQTEPFPEELLIRLRLQAVHEDSKREKEKSETEGKRETVISIAASQGELLGRSKDSRSESGRESSEMLEESKSTSIGIGGGSGGGLLEEDGGGSGAKGSEASITTGDQTDKKSEESGYSSSISDTVMRYLRMVRKNSKADNKETIDKFKTVNYDRSLRYIKSKNVTVEEALEHEKNKALGINQGKQPSVPLPPVSPPPAPVCDAPRKTSAKSAIKFSANPGTLKKKQAGASGQDLSTPSTSKIKSKTSKVKSETAVGSGTDTTANLVGGSSEASSEGFQKSLSPTTTDLELKIDEPESAAADIAESLLVLAPAAPICPSVGIQAGESLVRFLKDFIPRKFSDFSSTTSYCSSESPVEVTSPRYSIATTVMSSASEQDMYFHHAAAVATLMATGKYIKSTGGESEFPSTTTRSSIDMFSAADSSEYDDVFSNYQILQSASQFSHQQQPYMIQDATGSFPLFINPEPMPLIKNSRDESTTTEGSVLHSSPSTTSVPGLSTYSYSQRLTQIPSTYSSRHQKHQTHLELNTSGPKISSSTPSTPVASGSTSSSSSLMKSFFNSSPFASTFSSKVGFGFKKPTSTTSLVTQSLSTPSTSLLSSSAPPPTTSSSPNLLSLIHSSASSLIGGGTSRMSPSSSRGDPPIPSVSSSSLVSSKDHVISQYHRPLRSSSSSGVSFKGSLVTQKEKMTLPLGGSSSSGDRPSSLVNYSTTYRGGPSVSHNPMGSSSPSTVMQKSKSSSSVLPLYGSGGDSRGTSGTAAAPSTATKLISKSRIFKSRSKSSTRGSTGSSTTAPCTWAPQGKCKWKSRTGKTITLEPTTVLNLSEVERQTLQEVALEKLKTLSLDVDFKVPKDKVGGGQPKMKRRPYLLKKKALSTGFFESGTKRDEGKDNAGSGVVFGVSLSQCVANDRLKAEAENKISRNGSRNSLSSLYETQQKEEKGSTESLFRGKRGSVALVDVSADNPVVNYEPPPKSVPTIVTACVKHLENYGLHTTGIFRVSTSLKRIRQLREEIDGGKEIHFGEEHSPHDVAALLKEFLRDLPEPLLSRELYQAFLKTQRIRNRKQQLEATQHLVQLLPVANRDTLASLLNLFAKVVANASESRSSTGEILAGNKMEGYSLATLIAPNILPCMPTEGHLTSVDQNLTKERRDSIDVVNYMISNYKQLFEVTPDLLHDVYLHLMDTHPEAVEDILKFKSGALDDGMEEETSSVFEGSECGEVADVEETRVFRRREDILHEGAAKCSQGTRTDGRRERAGGGRLEKVEHHRVASDSDRGQILGRERMSKERGSESDRGIGRGRQRSEKDSSGTAEMEKAQSGGESDSSSTKSTSRWFRRTRADSSKARTSSDSGADKLKGTKRHGNALHESKRASSLDSMNVGTDMVVETEPMDYRPKSNSEQSLKVPENYNRRQSSPVLENSGVITASLKIPVPLPLNIDDSDIPFIEDDHLEGSHSHSFHKRLTQASKARGRSASTDSSALARTASSSITNTPISSPIRQPSSEASSPIGFSPPASPPFDPRTFPYEEMTARILIGSASPGSSSAGGSQSHIPSSIPPSSLSTVTASFSTSESKFPGSIPTVRSRTNINKGVPTEVTSSKVVTSLYVEPSMIGGGAASAPVSPQPPSPYMSGKISEPKSLGRETKAANIGGLIKSKTADFEKLVKSSTPATPSTSTYSIAPKMRLRSQDNIVLKQQFLLRQQHAESEGGSRTPTAKETKAIKPKEDDGVVVAKKPLTRRRQLVGSSSSSAIVGMGGGSSSGGSSSPIAAGRHGRSHEVEEGSEQSSTSRWKRSEIIASRQERQASGDTETFV